MTKKEALRLALSTLDEVRQEAFRLLRDGQKLYAEDKVWSTIITIKEVLAQQEAKDEPSIKVEGPMHVVCKCNKCKAQPEQEPVDKLQKPTVERAWFTIAELNDWADKKLLENPQWVMPKNEPQITFNSEVVGYVAPQRTWVGLTDEEVSKLIGKEIGFNSCCGWEEEYTRAVEAKLKEKNT